MRESVWAQCHLNSRNASVAVFRSCRFFPLEQQTQRGLRSRNKTRHLNKKKNNNNNHKQERLHDKKSEETMKCTTASNILNDLKKEWWSLPGSFALRQKLEQRWGRYSFLLTRLDLIRLEPSSSYGSAWSPTRSWVPNFSHSPKKPEGSLVNRVDISLFRKSFRLHIFTFFLPRSTVLKVFLHYQQSTKLTD